MWNWLPAQDVSGKRVGKRAEFILGPRKSWWLQWQSSYLETEIESHKNWYLIIKRHKNASDSSVSDTHSCSSISVTNPYTWSPDHALCIQVMKLQTWRDYTSQYLQNLRLPQQICGRQGVSLLFSFNAFVYSSLGHSDIEERQQISTAALRQQSSKRRTQFLFLPSVTLRSQVPWVGHSICRVRAVIRLQSAPCVGAQPAFEVLHCRTPNQWWRTGTMPSKAVRNKRPSSAIKGCQNAFLNAVEAA